MAQERPRSRNTPGGTNRRPTIGYLAPNISDDIGQARWHGVCDLARERGANLICLPGSYWREPGPRGQANIVYDLLSLAGLDGVILGNVLREDLASAGEIDSFYERLQGLPAVSLRETDRMPSVALDNYQGMREAIIHLAEVHHARRIAFLRGPEDHPTARDRYQAYLDGLQAVGLPFDPDLVTPPSDWNAPSIQVLLDERRLSPPADLDAIIAANDRKAIDALRGCQARGFHVPDDVAIVGSNDNVEGRATTPPLTSVAMPFYEQGRRAVEILLALLAGEQVPQQAPLPARLVVRQSCGCTSPHVVRAAVEATAAQPEGGRPALVAHRDQILADLLAAAPASIRASETAAAGLARVLDAYIAELSGTPAGRFVPALSSALRLAVDREGELGDWQGMISLLYSRSLAELPAADDVARAGGLAQQARILVGEAAARGHMQRTLQVQRQTEILQRIGQTLITSFEVEELTASLTQALPEVGIPSCYLSLYQDPARPGQGLDLILAYNDGERVALESEGRPLAPSLVPAEFLNPEQQGSFVAEPLYFRGNQLGLVVFETGPREGGVYEVLRGQISSVLQGAALIDQVENRALLIQATAEVSQVASGILDPGELIDRIVGLIRERFDLYYVGLFLVDQAERAPGERGTSRRFADRLDRWAYFQAGTGQAGQEMRKQKHRLQVDGPSMVGQCIASGKPCIAQDADRETLRFSNPLLPETRSELALPLISRGQTIGALSIQSSRQMDFTPEAIAIFQTMAGQLAHSIENAYLLEETQRAMEELKAIQRRYVREGWSRYLER